MRKSTEKKTRSANLGGMVKKNRTWKAWNGLRMKNLGGVEFGGVKFVVVGVGELASIAWPCWHFVQLD